MADGGPESCRMEGTSNCDIRTLDPAEPPEQDGCMTRKNVDFDFEESKLEHLTDWSRKEKEIDLLEKLKEPLENTEHVLSSLPNCTSFGKTGRLHYSIALSKKTQLIFVP